VLEATGNLDFSPFNQKNDKFRSSAISVFAKLDAAETVPVLLRALETGTTNNRTFACRVLLDLMANRRPAEVIKSQDQIIEALAETLRNRDHRVRLLALQTATTRAAPVTGPLGDRLREALQDDNPYVVVMALSYPSLVKASMAPDWFLSECLKLTRHKDPSVRRQAVNTLGNSVKNIPENAGEAMPRLIEMLGEGHDVRLQVCHVIADIGPPAKSAVPALIEIIKNSQETIERREAASALENIGPDAKGALPVLEPLVQGHQRDMDAAKPEAAYGRTDSLWYRAARALKSIRDPQWFEQMRKNRPRGVMGAYGDEMMYDSGFGSYSGGYEEEGGYGSMSVPGAGGSEEEEGGYGASEYESGPSTRNR
jgi:HEAT repeat protein